MTQLRSYLATRTASGTQPGEPEQNRLAIERRAYTVEGLVVVDIRSPRLPKVIELWLRNDAEARLGIGQGMTR